VCTARPGLDKGAIRFARPPGLGSHSRWCQRGWGLGLARRVSTLDAFGLGCSSSARDAPVDGPVPFGGSRPGFGLPCEYSSGTPCPGWGSHKTGKMGHCPAGGCLAVESGPPPPGITRPSTAQVGDPAGQRWTAATAGGGASRRRGSGGHARQNQPGSMIAGPASMRRNERKRKSSVGRQPQRGDRPGKLGRAGAGHLAVPSTTDCTNHKCPDEAPNHTVSAKAFWEQ